MTKLRTFDVVVGRNKRSRPDPNIGRCVSFLCIFVCILIIETTIQPVRCNEATPSVKRGLTPLAFHPIQSKAKRTADSIASFKHNGLRTTTGANAPNQRPYSLHSTARMGSNGPGFGFGDSPWESNRRRKNSGKKNGGRKGKKILQRYGSNSTSFSPTATSSTSSSTSSSQLELELLKRITQLEHLVATQSVEISRLKKQCDDLTDTAAAFQNVIELLREAGLRTDYDTGEPKDAEVSDDDDDDDDAKTRNNRIQGDNGDDSVEMEPFNDAEIFGTAPSSVVDAADSAGASILAAVLGGKQRMLVDVRDAELTRDPEALVQFIELSILPVAAGLEGLKGVRNRVKIVFPTVSQLLEYRRTMALAAPEVVALSTLSFGPIEDNDALVVILAPSPDDEEGLRAMNDLLDPNTPPQFSQPVVVLNHHMVPITGPAKHFDIVYQLRLFSVQYMAGDSAPEFLRQLEAEKDSTDKKGRENANEERDASSSITQKDDNDEHDNLTSEMDLQGPDSDEDDELEAAMKHAHEGGTNMGITRAMIIRAYPKPWHVFVDTSPDTDADFVIAASFDEEPSQEEVNYAIVECLEGSEQEDTIVAQQMQQALESGQLDNIMKFNSSIADGYYDDDYDDYDEDDEDDDDFDGFRIFPEDSV